MFILGLNGFAVNLSQVTAFYITGEKPSTPKHSVMAVLTSGMEVDLCNGDAMTCRNALQQLTNKLKDAEKLL